MPAINKIKKEITAYRTSSVNLYEGVTFSAPKLLRRIGLYKSQTYPRGKLDSQGNYKYWYDIITPRVGSEIKNIDFDTKDIVLYSDSLNDNMRVIVANAGLREYMDSSGQAAKLNSAVEQGTEWGNVIWKKTEKDYRVLELDKVMVLNQTAKTLKSSDVIEEECLTVSEIRKVEAWTNKDELIKTFKEDETDSSPEFYIYERNGEISEKEFYAIKESEGGKGKKNASSDKYLLAKIVVGGVEKDSPTTVLFCEEIKEMPYREYHRSSFSGRWLRVGLYEQLMDIQTRANEIGNQIARGLEWASKTIFKSGDKIIAQNIITDLQSGDIVKSKDLSQVDVRMQGLDQLIADWNRLMVLADQISNSYEVVTGGQLPSATPFRLGLLQNTNANKLFDFIREKLCIAFESVIKDWVLDEAMKDIKAKDVIRLSQDDDSLKSYYKSVIDSWYLENLLSLQPHSAEDAAKVKEAKLNEMMLSPETLVKLEKSMWEGFKPRLKVTITGENYNLATDLETLQTFISLETSPTRRTALIEMAMAKKGMDISSLPKDEPQAQQVQQATPTPLSGTISS